MSIAVTAATPARAETEADQLFREGRADLERGDYASACPKFERSYTIDPEGAGGGIVGNLAECEAHYGHLAKAWRLWNDAELRWKRAGKPSGVKLAHDQAAAVAESATTVVIGVSDPTAPGLAITLNGERIAPAKTIRSVVDPGPVEIVAIAAGAAPFRSTRGGAAGETVVVEIRLTASAGGVVTERRRSRVHAAWALGAAAGASGITGLSIALVANRRYDIALERDCMNDRNMCSDQGRTKLNDARHLANLGTGFGVAAGVIAASALVVFVTAPRDVVVAPTAASNAAGVAIVGQF